MNKDKKQIYYFERYYLSKKILKWQDFFNIFASFLAEDCYYYKLNIYFPKKEYKDFKNLFGIFPKDKQGKDDIISEMTKWIKKVTNNDTRNSFNLTLYDSTTLNFDNWKFQCNDSLTETFIRCSEKEFLEFQKYLKKNGLPSDLFYSEKDQVCISQFIGSRCFSPKEYEEYKNNNWKK